MPIGKAKRYGLTCHQNFVDQLAAWGSTTSRAARSEAWR